MKLMKRTDVVVVLGDLVGSRRATERAALHHRLTGVLDDLNERWGSDLRVTAGDEFQGTVPTLGAASAVALAVRLALLPEHDARHGIGVGQRRVLDPGTGIEDGPAWWAARAAIDDAHALAGRAATRAARTVVRVADGTAVAAGPDGALNAALLARDELVGRLDARSLSVLRGLLSGRTQKEIAADEGVSPSAVSQRLRHDALGVVMTTSSWLEAVR
ncbi:SatD family protein [Nocardioides marinquilinus]|uniref:SatD family protein n=1 Tax=Nocardioides marinquilinus TaxID=1210400 RepID=A0ABP9Q8W6_9ACTN